MTVVVVVVVVMMTTTDGIEQVGGWVVGEGTWQSRYVHTVGTSTRRSCAPTRRPAMSSVIW